MEDLARSGGAGVNTAVAVGLLLEQCRGLAQEGRHEESVSTAESAIVLAKAQLEGQEDSEECRLVVASASHCLGVALTVTNCLERALPLLEDAHSVRKSLLGERHADTVESAAELGTLYEKMARFTDALPLMTHALECFEEILGKDDPGFAIPLNNLANLYESMGLYEKALPLSELALQLTKESHGMNHPDSVLAMENLAAIYMRVGRYETALDHYKAALKGRELLGGSPAPLAACLNNMAYLYHLMGQYDEALLLFRRAMDIYDTMDTTIYDDAKAAAMSNFADLYLTLGKVEEAIGLHEEALSLAQSVMGAGHPSTATSLNNLACAFMSNNEFARALPLCERSLDIRLECFGPDHPDTAESLNNLAGLKMILGMSDSPELLQRAIGIVEASLGADHPTTALFTHNNGDLFFSVNKYDEALVLYDKALQMRLQSLHPLHMDLAHSYASIALLHSRCHRYEEALLAALGAAEVEIGHLRRMVPFLGPKARQLCLQQLPWGFAVAVAAAGSLPASAVSEAHRQLLCEWILQRKDVVATSQRLLRQLLAHGHQAESVLKLRRLRELQAMGHADKELLQAAEDLEEQIQAKEPLLRKYMKRAYYPELVTALRTRNAVLLEYVEGDGGFWVQCVTGSGACQLEALAFTEENLTPIVTGERMGLFLQRNAPHCPEGNLPPPENYAWKPSRGSGNKGDLTEEDELECPPPPAPSQSTDNADGVESGDGKDTKREKTEFTADEALYIGLVQPFEKYFEEASHVFVAATGVLHHLAFEALRNADGVMLVHALAHHNCGLSYVNVGRDIVELFCDERPVVPGDSKPVIIGGPYFDGTTANTLNVRTSTEDIASLKKELKQLIKGRERGRQRMFEELPGSESEAKAVAALLGVDAVTSEHATREHLLSIQRPPVLHVATHCWCSGESLFGFGSTDSSPKDTHPLLRTALVMAGANLFIQCEECANCAEPSALPHCKHCGSGLVTALELGELDLNGTELAVLSACSTGFGVGEEYLGHLGLRSALHQAGVRTAVVSLWPVGDRWTGLLMVAFYEALIAGHGRLQALRLAQRLIRSQGASDCDWAAFVLVGDPGPLPWKPTLPSPPLPE